MNLKTTVVASTLIAMLAFLVLATPALAAPPKVPIQGVLTDMEGKAIEGELEVIFTLYADSEGNSELWTGAQAVRFETGFFSTYLGEDNALPLDLFKDNASMWLGVAIDGDEEMVLVELATAPYAAFAQHAQTATDAVTLDGLGADAFAPAEHDTDWSSLTNIPADLADGDQDTLYDALVGGGIELVEAGQFGLTSACAPGQLLKRTVDGWDCAADDAAAGGNPTDELIATFSLDGTMLTITEAFTDHSVDLATLQDGVEDADADPLNELLGSVEFDEDTNTLTITDAGDTFAIDLSSLVGAADGDGDSANELLISASLDGTNLILTDAGNTFTVDLSGLGGGADGDADNSNELITGASLDGTTLTIIEGRNATTVNLAALQDGVDDADASPTNELITGATLQGTSLRINEAGVTTTVNLSSLQDGVNDADADPTNERNTGFSFQNDTLSITDSGGTLTADLSALRDGAWTVNGADVHRSSGNVGIGTGTPDADLTMGAAQPDAGAAVADLDKQLKLQGTANQGPNQGVKLWIGGMDNDGTTNYPIYVVDENDNVYLSMRSALSSGATIGADAPQTVFQGVVEATRFAGGTGVTQADGITRTFVGGGEDHVLNSSRAVIVGGRRNNVSGVRGFVGAGQDNHATGQESFIGGGRDNRIASQVACDETHTEVVESGDECYTAGTNIAGGVTPWDSPRPCDGTCFNTLSSPENGLATIAGGDNNHIASGNWAFIGGGSGNYIGGISGSGVIGGGLLNTMMGSVRGVIAGGQGNIVGPGDVSTVGGGLNNYVSSHRATISGGEGNRVSEDWATIGGGGLNSAAGSSGTVAGGYENTASGTRSTVGGGRENEASGTNATIPGGRYNTASGVNSFAAGRRAKAVHDGAFVWGDEHDADIESRADNEFSVRATGGVTLWTDGGLTSGARLAPGSGAWSNLSDRHSKENIELVDSVAILEALASIDIATWNWITQDDSIVHLGPMAQDFYAAFGLGDSNRRISTVDADGVALAAIQGLYFLHVDKEHQITELEHRVREQQDTIADLERRLKGQAELEKRLERLEAILLKR